MLDPCNAPASTVLPHRTSHSQHHGPPQAVLQAAKLSHGVHVQGMGRVATRLGFQPAHLMSASHRRLREAARKRHAKAVRVRSVRSFHMCGTA